MQRGDIDNIDERKIIIYHSPVNVNQSVENISVKRKKNTQITDKEYMVYKVKIH